MREPDPNNERWSLILTITEGSRTARERLIAEIKTRNASKVDELFRSEICETANVGTETGIFTAIYPHRRDLVDRLMRRHRNVTLTAVILIEGLNQREEATYAGGERIEAWRPCETAAMRLVTIATGPDADVATFAAVTASPETQHPPQEPLFCALAVRETRRDVRVGAVRLQHDFPEHDGVTSVPYAVAEAFPALRLACWALPADPRLAHASAVFQDGAVLAHWGHPDVAGSLVPEIERRWADIVKVTARIDGAANDGTSTSAATGSGETSHLLITVIDGTRAARERLKIDLLSRYESKADDLLTSVCFDTLVTGDRVAYVATVHPHSHDAVDRFMQHHADLDVDAVLRVDGVAKRELATYYEGVRSGPWSSEEEHAVELVVDVTGASELVARFADIMARPDAFAHKEADLLVGFHANEHSRNVGDSSARIVYSLPTLAGLTEMTATLSGVFAGLRFAFQATPKEPEFFPAQAVFESGVPVVPWHHPQAELTSRSGRS